MAEQSLWLYFADAGMVVKSVMLILLAASLISWTFIIQRFNFLKNTHQESLDFENLFWSGKSLEQLHLDLRSAKKNTRGLAHIFQAGFNEFTRLTKNDGRSSDDIMLGVERAMRIAHAKETEKLETHLPFLASVGSTSPYIGLFGTVWGIMTSFHALGSVQQATIAMVAPGISEALIATAMGLFAAIPAVLAYNRFSAQVDRMSLQYDTFQDELSGILHREATGTST